MAQRVVAGVHTAPDGSPVRLYQRLPERAEDAALIHGLLPAGGTVLDLGCATGRLAEPLARLGHPVTGVDNEPEMLDALRLATGVRAEITTLDLAARFDAVLLMSHFVDAADRGLVGAMLRTVRRHVREDGFAVIERHPPGWAAACTGSAKTIDGVRYTLCDLHRAGGVLTATIRYEFDGLSAGQRFSVRDVDDDRLTRLAGAAGLLPDCPLNPAGTLVLLRPPALPPRRRRHAEPRSPPPPDADHPPAPHPAEPGGYVPPAAAWMASTASMVSASAADLSAR